MARREGFHWNRGRWRPSRRQRQILDALIEAKTNPEIADALGVSVAGVRWQVSEMLGETGLKDRQALAAWWREERERHRQPGFIPKWLHTPRLAIAAGAAAVVLAVAGWLLLGGDGNGRGEQPPTEQASVDEGFLSGGRIRAFDPLFEKFLVELTVEGGNGESRVDLRDAGTGEEVGSVNAGYRPMVVVRQDAEELLVSSGLNQGSGKEFLKVIQIYDLRGYSLQLKRTIETPNRINCTTYCQPMVLSRDERYLYYGTRTTAPECGAGGDASICDLHRVVMIDLEDESDTRMSIELRRGCGVPVVAAAGESGAIVACRGQYPAPGGWTAVLEPGQDPRVADLATSQLQIAHLTAAGEIVVIDNGGSVSKEDANGRRSNAKALPTDLGFGPRVFYIGAQDVGGDRLFIVFDSADYGSHDRKYGFVVFDLKTMTIEGYGRVPEALAYLPHADSVFVLRQGRIDVLNLQTGELRLLSNSVGPYVEALLPGR